MIEKIINETEENKTYIIFPKMYVNELSSFIQTGKQIFFNKNSNPELILGKIIQQIEEKIDLSYPIEYKDTIYIQYRSLSEEINLKEKEKEKIYKIKYR
jgi:hypothetical protein